MKPKKKTKITILEDRLFEEFRFFGVPMPVRQYHFHQKRDWAFDFAWPDRMIAVEVNGGNFVYGAHARGMQMELDYERVNEAQRLGWKVFTFGTVAVRRKKRSQSASPAASFIMGILTGADTRSLSRGGTYPRPCGLCPGQIVSEADLDWHGLGNCVAICDRCTGSGIEPKLQATGSLFDAAKRKP